MAGQGATPEWRTSTHCPAGVSDVVPIHDSENRGSGVPAFGRKATRAAVAGTPSARGAL
jgi:hypothetical protein